jgi:single-strand DNA-binding protein
MVSFNKVFLVGNLTKDPELRYTPQGAAVSTIRIAVNTPFKDKGGQLQKDTCFVNIVVWGQMAENCNQYLQKGRQVFVDGRLQSRSWQNNEGQNRSVIEVRAARVQFMPRAVKEGGREIDLGDGPEEVINLENDTDKELGEVV